TCESTPAGSATSRCGGSGGGQQQQQRPLETLSPQQLREWAVRRGSPGGGGFRSTHTEGVEAPGGVEATSPGACDLASSGPEPEEALHTFTLDSGPSRYFFRDSTTVTPLTAPVPVTLADPSRGSIVARGTTVLPCPATPSGLLTGLHLPSFAKYLVATFVLHDQWVTVTQPGSELVAICTDSRTGEHLATFTRQLGSGLYTLTTKSAPVAESGQVAASVEVAASCSCRLLTHQTLLWHHRLGHPSLPRLRGMHSRLLVCGLPRFLPPVPRSLAPPCLPCVEERQRVSPHSSSFPPTTAHLQTFYMDVWGPARFTGQGGECYFLLIVDDYTRYTTVFPLQSKADVRSDLPVLRLHSDQGGEFFSHLLEDFCGAEGIVQSYTLPASSQQNGFAERRIGLVMEVARTSMIHATTPHFLWLFAVRYAVEQLNLWPRVSHPETSPTLRWTGEVGDASAFWVWGSLSLVRDLPAGKLSPRVVYSLPPLSLVDDPPPVGPLPPPGPAPSAEEGDQTATNTVVPRRSARLAVPPGFQPRPSSPPLRPVAVDFGAAGGGDTGGADSGGAGFGGAASPTGAGGAGGAAAGGYAGGGAGGAGAGGAGARRLETLSPERLREWAVHWGSPGGGAWHARAAGFGGYDPGGASAGVPGVGRAGGTSAGGTGATGGTGGAAIVGVAAGSPGSRCQEPLSSERLREWAVRWGSPGGGTGRAGAAGSGGAGPGGASTCVPGVDRAGGTGSRGTGAAGGTGGAGPRGASAGVPGVGRAGGTGTGGIGTARGTGGAGPGGASLTLESSTTCIMELLDDILLKILAYSSSNHTIRASPCDSLWEPFKQKLKYITGHCLDESLSAYETKTSLPTPPCTNATLTLTITSVCHRWHRLFQHHISTLLIKDGLTISHRDLADFVIRFPNLTHLHLRDRSMETLDDATLAHLAFACPKLTALHVGRGITQANNRGAKDEYPITEAGLDHLFLQCTRLEHLSLFCLHKQAHLPVSFFRLTHLRTLVQQDTSTFESPNLAHLSSLTSLYILVPVLTDRHLLNLVHLPKLTCLSITVECAESRTMGHLLPFAFRSCRA
ncbi:unnamed protein product, partial [Closterium sp. NIES-53]